MNPNQDTTSGRAVNRVVINGGSFGPGRLHVFNQFQHIKVTNAGRARPGIKLPLPNMGAAGTNGVCPNHTVTLDGVQGLSGTIGNEMAVRNFRFDENGGVHEETVSESQRADMSLVFNPMAARQTVVPSGPAPVVLLQSPVAGPEAKSMPGEPIADKKESESESERFNRSFLLMDPEDRYAMIREASHEHLSYLLKLIPAEELDTVIDRLDAETSDTQVQ